MYLNLKKAIESERVKEFISQDVSQCIQNWDMEEIKNCKTEEEVRNKAEEILNQLDWLNLFDGHGLSKDDFDEKESALKNFQAEFISSWNAEFRDEAVKLWEKEQEEKEI